MPLLDGTWDILWLCRTYGAEKFANNSRFRAIWESCPSREGDFGRLKIEDGMIRGAKKNIRLFVFYAFFAVKFVPK
ncbi:MAG TPA: hypothetical protein VNV43_14380 [Candidatus Acidoferrales bacterium]|jgi:hypothetical protein|nr:hypothetical protein [Candidatus Acidoferrales bacterium]